MASPYSSQMRILPKAMPAPAKDCGPPRQRSTSSSTSPITLKISSEPLSVVDSAGWIIPTTAAAR